MDKGARTLANTKLMRIILAFMRSKLHRGFIAPAMLALSTFGFQLSTAQAQGTAFTYQGQLTASGAPASGTYDLSFAVYDAASAGTLGGTLTNAATPVTGGLFMVTLDFGAGIFDGTPRWLEIAARTNGSGAFTVLAPRQPLTAAPYALYAPNAGNAATASTAATVGPNSVAPAQLNTAGLPASGQVLAYNGSGLVWTNPPAGSSSSGWSLTGNSGTTPGLDFLGTTDNQPLDLWAGNSRGLRLQYATAASSFPSLEWHESGVNVIGGYAANYMPGSVVGGTIAGGGYRYWGILSGSTDYTNSVTDSFGTVGGGYGNTAGPGATVPGGYNNIATGDGSFAAGRNAQTTNSGSFVWSDGSQTATSSGVNCFDVWAAGGVFFHTGNSLLAGLNVDPNNLNIGNVYSNALTFGTASGEGIASKRNGANGSWDLEFYTDFQNRMTISQDGNVNVGNLTISGNLNLPAAATISSGGNSLFAGLSIDPNNLNVGNVKADALTFGGASSGEGIASDRGGAAPKWDLEFYTDYTNRMTIAQDGNVGIGTTSPTETLEINGTSRIDDNDLYFRAGSNRNHGMGYRATVSATGVDGPFLYGWSGGALGTPSPESVALRWDRQGNVVVQNNLSTATLTIRGGGDVAEPFLVTGSQVEPGTVMVIDEANPGQLRRSTQAYDTRVAGIISGAGGIKPGLSLQQDGVLDQGQKVALSGRVYVLADASAGAIRPGDLLTTAATPGCAMKVSDHARAQGAILGKAMTGLKEGKGLVLVLVTLQ